MKKLIAEKEKPGPRQGKNGDRVARNESKPNKQWDSLSSLRRRQARDTEILLGNLLQAGAISKDAMAMMDRLHALAAEAQKLAALVLQSRLLLVSIVLDAEKVAARAQVIKRKLNEKKSS